jgi:hypothetical protein
MNGERMPESVPIKIDSNPLSIIDDSIFKMAERLFDNSEGFNGRIKAS